MSTAARAKSLKAVKHAVDEVVSLAQVLWACRVRCYLLLEYNTLIPPPPCCVTALNPKVLMPWNPPCTNVIEVIDEPYYFTPIESAVTTPHTGRYLSAETAFCWKK